MQSFVKCSALYEVHLKKSDSYDAVVEKISDVVQLPAVDGEIFLLTCRGLIIIRLNIRKENELEG